jgi:hypothetical protein
MAPQAFFPGYVIKGAVSEISAVKDHELGRLTFDKGRILQYVKFGAGAARYSWVGLDIAASAGDDAANTVVILTPNGTHAVLGVAEYGGTINNYGWITRFGGATARVDATCALGVPLTNAGAATGLLSTLTSATILKGMRGYGTLAGAPSILGSHVNVNSL